MRDGLDADAIRRALTDTARLVTGLRLDEGAVRQAHGILICCLWHSERNASCSITLGPDGTIRVHCFGCGISGDVFHLIAKAHGLDVQRDFPKVRELAAEIAGLGPSVGGASHTAPRLRPAVPTPSPRTYPPRDEVLELVAACTPVCDDLPLRRDLETRGIDPATVTDRDLARTLSGTARLPRWARSRGGTWAETGHRLIVPLYDASGQIVTVRARRLLGEDRPKALPPTGYRHDSAVMADPLARLLLAGKPVDWWTRRRVLIAEPLAAEGDKPGKRRRATSQQQPADKPARERDERLPPVGTVLRKVDRHGNVRCECTIEEGGIRYNGTLYKSLSAAAIAATKDMGLKSKTMNGWSFWGLTKPARPLRDTLESLERAWERYRQHAAAAAQTASTEERPRLQSALHQHASALLELAAVGPIA